MVRTEPSDDARVTILVRGRVQGVGYREYIRNRARRLGCTGFARNELDGSVTIVAEGSRQSLEELLALARRGPITAHVESIDIRWAPSLAEYTSFERR
jgi:acylphosphatase